jgi:alkylation response protein AidB-like acyl-CoA dehydrogenase
MGLRGFSFGRIHLTNVEVESEDRRGDGGDGVYIFNRHFARWRVFMGLLGLGAAQQSLDETFDHVRAREVYGRRISEIPQVAHHLAHHLTQVSATRALSYWALEGLARDSEAYEGSAMSKVAATVAAYRAIDYCVQLHGAKGYTSSLRLEKRLRDIRGLMIADGPNDVLIASIARSRLGSPLKATEPPGHTTTRSA